MNDSYKLYQLMHFFVMKFSYKILNVQGQKNDELFLISPSHSLYPLIRITLSSIEQVTFDKDRLHMITDNIFYQMHIKTGRLLDIHIFQDEILDHEEFDSIALDLDYYAGLELNDIYPGIKNVLHKVADPSKEIEHIMRDLAEYSKASNVQKKKIKRHDLPIVTYVTIAICLIFFILTYLLERNYTSVDSLIALGANYKTFTVGLHEFWRLLTSGFLHSGIFHLIFNMLSLYSLGRIMEPSMGSLKFALTLFGSLIVASLTSLAFSDNTISVGLSGGLYGLFAIYLINAYYSHTLSSQGAIQVILINVLINFMGGVDFMAHIGGLIAGIVFYFIFLKKQNVIIYLCLLVVLIWRVYILKTPYTIYGGTDLAVVEIYRDLGLEGHADRIQSELFTVWSENG